MSDDAKPDAEAEYASPACGLQSADPVYSGYLPKEEVLAFLNMLLEAERAGARGVGEMCTHIAGAEPYEVLHEVAADEARFCAMLTRHIERIGGAPSRQTGAFYDKLLAETDLPAQLQLLNKGQGWVAKRLRQTLPRIWDQQLFLDLSRMLIVHEHNLKRCDTLAL